jgi:diguanylate cyclase (GGDEF)-like protein
VVDVRILVVEDSRFFSQLVSGAIRERLGVEVVVAASFAEARAVVEAPGAPFTLALCDIVLPDSRSGEAVEYLFSRRIPVVVFTGVFSPDLRERLISQAVIDYVVKDTPSSLDYLVSLVERLLKNRDVEVLVVDDSQVVRHHLTELLTSYQYRVHTAADGAAALGMLAENPAIRLVVTDYHMPKMDGIEMIKRMRATHDQEHLAIIGMSSAGSHVLSAQFIKSGANDFITKPFQREEFFCRVMQNMKMLDMIDRLKETATRDFLTGLNNRRFFFDAGQAQFAAMKRGQATVTAAMIDIDFFKKVNDTWGHDGGDAVLKAVARTLRAACRQTDLVARFGGEEFAILAVNITPTAAAALFEKVRAAIEAAEIVFGGMRIPVTCSIGLCTEPLDSLDSMLAMADARLYQAKQHGRNRVEMG